MARTTRNRTGTGQLLLLAALLLGIVTMHTLGHPPEHTSDTATASAPAAASVPATASVVTAASVTSHGADFGADYRADHGADPRGGHDVRVASPAADSPHGMTHDGHGAMSMDPLSVCLAVLGAFTLVALVRVLVRAGLWRPGRAPARAPAAGRLLHGPRPEPPPVTLSRLSVLRL
ncbi:hypothetical protein [Streptomyces sp. DSM 118878]